MASQVGLYQSVAPVQFVGQGGEEAKFPGDGVELAVAQASQRSFEHLRVFTEVVDARIFEAEVKPNLSVSSGIILLFSRGGVPHLIIGGMQTTGADNKIFDESFSVFSGSVRLADKNQPTPALVHSAIRKFLEETEGHFNLSYDALANMLSHKDIKVVINRDFFEGSFAVIHFLLEVPERIAEQGIRHFNAAPRAAGDPIREMRAIGLRSTLDSAVAFYKEEKPNAEGELNQPLLQQRQQLEGEINALIDQLVKMKDPFKEVALCAEVNACQDKLLLVRQKLHLPVQDGARSLRIAERFLRTLVDNEATVRAVANNMEAVEV